MAIGLKIVDGDFVVNNNGGMAIVGGTDKTSRDFEKMLVTEREDTEIVENSKRYNPYYGTKLNWKRLFKNLNIDLTVDVINDVIREAMEYYMSIQEQRDNLSAAEIITDIEFYTYPDPDDKRYVIATIKLFTGNGQIVDLGEFQQEII